MAKIVWYYQWQANGRGNDPQTCSLFRFTDDAVFPGRSDTVAARMPSMAEDYGTPTLITRPEGVGLLFPNGGSWALWVMAVEPD